jgi:hypothetical protein
MYFGNAESWIQRTNTKNESLLVDGLVEISVVNCERLVDGRALGHELDRTTRVSRYVA